MAFDPTSPNHPSQSGEAAMEAIKENHNQNRKHEAGTSQPSNAVATQFWPDLTNGLMKQRNQANNAWITLWELDKHYPSFPSGTKMVFFQASAPTGWTQDTTHNNKALRVVSGSGGGSGGTHDLSSPPSANHQHELPIALGVAGSTNTIFWEDTPSFGTSGSSGTVWRETGSDTTSGLALALSEDTGPTAFAPKYIDVIVATKD